MVSVSVRYLFYQRMDEKIKTWTLRFYAKENPNMKKALFDWPIVLQYDVKAKYRLISRKFSGLKFFHPSVKGGLGRPGHSPGSVTVYCNGSHRLVNFKTSARLFTFYRWKCFFAYGRRQLPGGTPL